MTVTITSNDPFAGADAEDMARLKSITEERAAESGAAAVAKMAAWLPTLDAAAVARLRTMMENEPTCWHVVHGAGPEMAVLPEGANGGNQVYVVPSEDNGPPWIRTDSDIVDPATGAVIGHHASMRLETVVQDITRDVTGARVRVDDEYMEKLVTDTLRRLYGLTYTEAPASSPLGDK